MNENVVTLNVQDDLLSINDLIALHAARGQSILREREQALQEKARRQEEEREAHNEELWRPLVEAVRAAMPGWAHGFLVWNRRAEPYWHNRFEDRVYRPMIVRVPDCAPIEAYTLERPDDAAFQGVWFRAARPELRRDAELGWYILETACGLGEYTIAREGDRSFDVALYRAHENAKNLPALRQELERKRAEAPREANTPSYTPLDALRRRIDALLEADRNVPVNPQSAQEYLDLMDTTEFWAAIVEAEALHALAEQARKRASFEL